jgi:hypothetical protein
MSAAAKKSFRAGLDKSVAARQNAHASVRVIRLPRSYSGSSLALNRGQRIQTELVDGFSKRIAADRF